MVQNLLKNHNDSHSDKKKPDYLFALAGNANVGKSAIFNQLTGAKQILGNWPGKTVEQAKGFLTHHRKKICIIDLPGIYSFSPYSEEERIARDFIQTQHPDLIINVVDANSLERSLFFTLQLLEMQIPVVLSVNLVDVARKKGIDVDVKKLENLLGVPVVATIAVRGEGVHELIDNGLQLIQKKASQVHVVQYGAEIERRIAHLSEQIEKTEVFASPRWIAIKLLEGDTEISDSIHQKNPNILILAHTLSNEIAAIHKESCATVIASERYAFAARIAQQVQSQIDKHTIPLSERFDSFSMHAIWGYAFLFFILLSIMLFMIVFGGWLAGVFESVFMYLTPSLEGFWVELLWNGAMLGLFSAVAVGFGYILPFYLILGVLEDMGYLPKVAYLMDRPCHMVGLHGKASLPLLLAFGCNVPACAGCRIIETKRDRLIAMTLSTLIPCSARSVVILGLVGVFVGIPWALGLYIFDFVLIFLIGRLLNRTMPGESVGIIMDMPSYHSPSPRVVARQAWHRFSEFVYIAVPFIVIGSMVLEAMRLSGLLEVVSAGLSPLTVMWLGLPAFTGVLLIFGILRKEAALVLLATVAGTLDIGSVMTGTQMVVFALVIMLYIPCLSTIAVLIKEAGWKHAMMITFGEIALALFVGGIAFRLLSFVL